MSVVLAIDPGETTGLAWIDSAILNGGALDERLSSLVEHAHINGTVPDQLWKIHKGILRLDVRVLVYEASDHFLLSPARKGRLTRSSLVPIEFAGGLKFLVRAEHEHHRPLALVAQTPSQAKGVITDTVLNTIGFMWKRTSEERHDMDAARHLILFLRRYRESKRARTSFAETVENEAFRPVSVQDGRRSS